MSNNNFCRPGENMGIYDLYDELVKYGRSLNPPLIMSLNLADQYNKRYLLAMIKRLVQHTGKRLDEMINIELIYRIPIEYSISRRALKILDEHKINRIGKLLLFKDRDLLLRDEIAAQDIINFMSEHGLVFDTTGKVYFGDKMVREFEEIVGREYPHSCKNTPLAEAFHFILHAMDNHYDKFTIEEYLEKAPIFKEYFDKRVIDKPITFYKRITPTRRITELSEIGDKLIKKEITLSYPVEEIYYKSSIGYIDKENLPYNIHLIWGGCETFRSEKRPILHDDIVVTYTANKYLILDENTIFGYEITSIDVEGKYD